MHRYMTGLARALAVIGGTILTLLILLTCVSVIGRSLNSVLNSDAVQTLLPTFSNLLLDLGIGPVNGDFELVEAGVAFAIFAFLPLCQITAAHATVDVFSAKFPQPLQRFIAMVVEMVFALILILIAWRLFDGMLSKRQYNETTFLLQFPIWWAYAASFVGAAVASLVAIYMAGVRTREFVARRSAPGIGPEPHR